MTTHDNRDAQPARTSATEADLDKDNVQPDGKEISYSSELASGSRRPASLTVKEWLVILTDNNYRFARNPTTRAGRTNISIIFDTFCAQLQEVLTRLSSRASKRSMTMASGLSSSSFLLRTKVEAKLETLHQA
jgi:hypothetical protein